MKYLTIGAKILEKHVEIRPLETKVGAIAPKRSDLIQNLINDWSNHSALIEVGHERMERPVQPSADVAVLQAFIAALRYFPYLSAEAPLRDLDKTVWWAGGFDKSILCRLYLSLKDMGFYNKNIEKGCQTPAENGTMLRIPKKRREWRGGKPCLGNFTILHQLSFLPQLFPETFDQQVPPEIRVQSDILQAFFGGKPKLQWTTPTPTTTADIDMNLGINDKTRIAEIKAQWGKGVDKEDIRGKVINKEDIRGKKKKRRAQGIARTAAAREKAGIRTKHGGYKFRFSLRHAPDIPATRTSALHINSPVDLMSHAPADLVPPLRHPDRNKRKHDKLKDVEEVVEIRNRAMQDPGTTQQKKRVKVRQDLTNAGVEQAFPAPTTVQNSTPAIQGPVLRQEGNTNQEVNPEIPDTEMVQITAPAPTMVQNSTPAIQGPVLRQEGNTNQEVNLDIPDTEMVPITAPSLQTDDPFTALSEQFGKW
jgi:hypothetical protein